MAETPRRCPGGVLIRCTSHLRWLYPELLLNYLTPDSICKGYIICSILTSLPGRFGWSKFHYWTISRKINVNVHGPACFLWPSGHLHGEFTLHCTNDACSPGGALQADVKEVALTGHCVSSSSRLQQGRGGFSPTRDVFPCSPPISWLCVARSGWHKQLLNVDWLTNELQ